jgi:hypothetical protein
VCILENRNTVFFFLGGGHSALPINMHGGECTLEIIKQKCILFPKGGEVSVYLKKYGC